MWSPEDNLPHRAGRTYEADLSLRYLAPGAFTILPPGHDPPSDPQPTSNKHRLTPTTRKHRNAAFAIIAEPSSNSGSRSPSPTGRVSPFRGRGFNPVGSRHASPLPSPPPDEQRGYSPTRRHHQHVDLEDPSAKRSKIPTLSRRGSAAGLFGEKIDHPETRSPRRPTPRTNLTRQYSQSLTNISPRRVSDKPPPSPRRTRRHSKTPAFQKLSPIVGSSPERTPNMHKLKPQSQSSPSKIPRSRSQPPSTKISPNVSNVASRVNSRNPSRNASRNPSREPSPSRLTDDAMEVSPRKEQKIKSDSSSTESTHKDKNETIKSDNGKTKKAEESSPTLMDLLQPSTTTVVSSTTTTVTQPLKIEAKFDVTSRNDTDKSDLVYLPDARALSATSVSTAMNRMNDTVLDTKTLMKETNLSSKLPPAASAIINMASNENTNSHNVMMMSAHTNSSESNGKGSPISHDHGTVALTDALPKSANERLKEARTMVATDVQPIRIMVKEKPTDSEVQSGNVRLPVSATNGINERPGTRWIFRSEDSENNTKFKGVSTANRIGHVSGQRLLQYCRRSREC
ncbi:hypothetical protein ILUMI_09714 [Ignelater luminosus]|uniref:Uncharacterized protein n=1 Tax=Ignelater luminosus TaxID=2038154 RepID=A0A8K0G9D9_IGNLU|nr:hypothetical protein ILUMI_09714 [Ignelater luminosus]